MANGKRYDNAVQTFDREANFAPNEAVAMSKQLATAKFDETIELVCRLGVDPRKAEEMVRGTVAPIRDRTKCACSRIRTGRSGITSQRGWR